MGFGNASGKHVSGSAREVFLKALSSGVSESAAATAAGISHSVGHRWARAAGFAAQSRHSGVVYSAQQREVFWAAMQLGASTAEASRTAGVSEQAGSYWVKQAGFVRRTAAPADTVTPPTARPRAPLTFTERWRLEQLLEQGCSCAEAAAALDRHRDTITRDYLRAQGVKSPMGRPGRGRSPPSAAQDRQVGGQPAVAGSGRATLETAAQSRADRGPAA